MWDKQKEFLLRQQENKNLFCNNTWKKIVGAPATSEIKTMIVSFWAITIAFPNETCQEVDCRKNWAQRSNKISKAT